MWIWITLGVIALLFLVGTIIWACGGREFVECILAIMLAILLVLALTALEFLVVAGIYWLLCWAFSWVFSWKIAIGIWVIVEIVLWFIKFIKRK